MCGVAKNLLGNRYGRLLVRSRADTVISHGRRFTVWNCLCDCGNMLAVRANSLRSGATKSCGCRYETFALFGVSCEKVPEYRIYRHMLSRCYNSNVPDFANYGGRGITVCNRWLKGFLFFYKDMGKRPSTKYSIDRINVNGNYTPKNCRWATRMEQARNKRNNVFITCRNVTFCLSDWAYITGISTFVLRRRIFVLGWSTHKSLTTPVA